MMTLQDVCLRNIVVAEIPMDGLPWILQMEKAYFLHFHHFARSLSMMIDMRNIFPEDEDEDFYERCFRDMMAIDNRDRMYLKSLDSRRLIKIINILLHCGYKDGVFFGHLVLEFLIRNDLPRDEKMSELIYIKLIRSDHSDILNINLLVARLKYLGLEETISLVEESEEEDYDD